MAIKHFAAAIVLSLGFTALADESDRSRSPIGRQIAAFQLNDFLGSAHSSAEWKDQKAVVVTFLGVECPLAKLYGKRLMELDEQYRRQNVQFVGIDSNQQDSLADIAHYARLHKIDFPLLKDPGNKIADRFDAQRTPEAFLLDPTGKILYRGAIDDQYGVGFSRAKAEHEYLVNAIDQWLAGEKIAIAETPASGCYIGRVNPTKPTGDITYSRQIAGILNRHCVSCHRADQIAPFTLTSYDDVVGWGETICEVIKDQRMPPWHANPDYGAFWNDARMPDDEQQLIFQWVKNGMPQGNPDDLPQPPKFTAGWRITKPDLVVKMPKAFTVPAKGSVPYQYFVIDPGFKEDVWVRGTDARPGNPAVVHHMILFWIGPEQDQPNGLDALNHAIASFAPGMPANLGPDALARRIPAGSKLVFQMHYTPIGSEQIDRSAAGMVLADPKKVKKEIKLGAALNGEFQIPPRAADHAVEAKHRFDEAVLLFSLTPHMHLRGKSFRFTAIYPDQRQEILLDVPRYDFHWQNTYLLKPAKVLPPGTELACEAHFDNSAQNMSNPDPNRAVSWGDQTWEEMVIGSFAIALVDQDLTLGQPTQERQDDGRYEVTFRYKPSTPAEAVYLSGDFNHWKPDELKMVGPDKGGFHTIKQTLSQGRYEYQFVVDGKEWKPDPGVRERTEKDHRSVLRVGRLTPYHRVAAM
ncbi:MAG: redoxin domain-containing protein [Pirellulales bacterium]|nr:redoxin domain-containing protein [Pirellulales bacterium]